MKSAQLMEKLVDLLEREENGQDEAKSLIQSPRTMDLRKYHRQLAEATMKKTRRIVQESIGIDPNDVPWSEFGPGFKVSQLRENVEKMASPIARILEGAVAFSTFGQLLRYGVQNFMFDSYVQVPVVYPDLVAVRPSKNNFEWYAPMYRAEMPTDIVQDGRIPESRLQGLDIIVQNKWVGRILAIDRILVDDDQTGQIVKKASELGEMTRYKEELDVMNAIGTGGINNNGITMGYSTAIGNTDPTNPNAASLTQPTLETADIQLSVIKDPNGNFMLVLPNMLLTGSANKFVAAKLLNSTLQPGVPGAAGQTASTGTSGTVGWTMTINPLQGLYDFKWSRFLPTAAWYLMQAKTSLVFQDRMPLEVAQEVPLSGAGFEQNIYRWRAQRRYNTIVIESRFIYQGHS